MKIKENTNIVLNIFEFVYHISKIDNIMDFNVLMLDHEHPCCVKNECIERAHYFGYCRNHINICNVSRCNNPLNPWNPINHNNGRNSHCAMHTCVTCNEIIFNENKFCCECRQQKMETY